VHIKSLHIITITIIYIKLLQYTVTVHQHAWTIRFPKKHRTTNWWR